MHFNRHILYVFLACLVAAPCGAVTSKEAFKRCVEKGTRNDVEVCMVGQLEITEAAMNTLYRQKLGAARNSDFNTSAELERQLEKSQKAFEAYKEAECERIWLEYSGGSGANNGSHACKIDMTNERIRILNEAI